MAGRKNKATEDLFEKLVTEQLELTPTLKTDQGPLELTHIEPKSES